MTSSELTARKTRLEDRLSKLAGFPIEVTIRGDRDFTLSAEGSRDFSKALRFFSLTGRIVNVSQEYDAECDYSCLYFSVR